MSNVVYRQYHTIFNTVKPHFLMLLHFLKLFYFSASSPVLVNPPQNLTAWDGKDATIPCKAEGAPAPNITWFFNGEFDYVIEIIIIDS
jgi:hypothetical protein